MAKGTKLWYNTHRGIMIPAEAHQWLIKRAGEQQTEKGHRVAVGDVVLEVIRKFEEYEKEENHE